MMAMMSCKECTRLWSEYQAATILHVRLDNDLRTSVAARNLDEFKLLAESVEQAELSREQSRRALAEHQAASGHS